ncbi:MAG: DinB family protein [Chlorobiaceae bacterium]|nr:DinB family protein [Chlorobiaceae bacterium]MBA4309928.1 DinB family protein [Chlorobiaceae bacterium]
MRKPIKGEFPSYYEFYYSYLNDEDVIDLLEKQKEKTIAIFSSLQDSSADYAYDKNKWTIKELFGHVIDTERIFGYRILTFARNDKNIIAGYEQDDYILYGKFGNRSIKSLLDEYVNLRMANIILFKSFSEEELNRKGIANNNEVTVRAIIHAIAGHEAHHLKILEERYLKS